MAINSLCSVFRKIAVSRISTAAAVARYSMQHTNSNVNVISRVICDKHNISYSADSIHNVKFIPGTLNIDFGMSNSRDLVRNIIEEPIGKILPLHEPIRRLPIPYDSPALEKLIELPSTESIFEKQAVRLIVIRRKKIKKHKRKKLRKKMKFEWAKMRLRRSKQREKVFQTELINQIQQARAFDAKAYVQERLNILNKERIPRVYRGEIIPIDMIKKFLAEKEAKKAAKRNKPRLTL